MTLKWKLFCIVNYVFIIFYFILLILTLRYIVEVVPGDAESGIVSQIIVILLVFIINSFLNVYIFHKHLPGKPFSSHFNIFYIISTILFAICLVLCLFILSRDMNMAMKEAPSDGSTIFLQILFFSNFFLGLFILINQFLIKKAIDKNYRNSLNNQIEDIGN